MWICCCNMFICTCFLFICTSNLIICICNLSISTCEPVPVETSDLILVTCSFVLVCCKVQFISQNKSGKVKFYTISNWGFCFGIFLFGFYSLRRQEEAWAELSTFMDKLKLTGYKNLGRVFKSRHAITLKQTNLKLKTQPKQLLGYLPLAFTLPGKICSCESSVWNSNHRD